MLTLDQILAIRRNRAMGKDNGLIPTPSQARRFNREFDEKEVEEVGQKEND